MAKVSLKIDGKNKVFTKNKMTLGVMKLRGEFESKIKNAYGMVSELQDVYRKHRNVLNQLEKTQEKLADAETDEQQDAIFDELEEIENSDEYKAFEDKIEEVRENNKDSEVNNFNIYDELATLLVEVFDNQFTYDDVMNGLETDDNETPPEIYARIFRTDDMGKRKKKATTTKTKQQTKS
ncbi:hypothetical protein [Staphylococcus haemolyticus]|uniref:hypothetical protein n=1 Tax=Staphylococcus haemolyticus TaxID=1283 RepID=UPI00069F92D0|nr:hypothetical protein [Staphylococcus haemolyticus]